MRARRVLRTTLVVGAAAAVLAAPAFAQTSGGSGYAWAETGDDSATVGAEDGSQSSTGSGGGSGGSLPCTWTPVEAGTVGEQASLVFERTPNTDYAWYLKECTNPDGTVSSQFVAIEDGEGGLPPDPELLRARAMEELRLPGPGIAMSPPGDQVVHVTSWLWVDNAIWRPHSQSASAGGVTATVTAVPSRTVWEMGNGEVVVCAGPGEAYDPSRPDAEQSTNCSFTYLNSSAGLPGDAYVVMVTIEWELSWSVTGAAGGGPLPGLTTSSTMPVPVSEMQALNQ